jgi:hypothetical protein
MKKYYIDEDNSNAVDDIKDKPLTRANLQSLLHELNISAELEFRGDSLAVVRVTDNIGTSQYFSSSSLDYAYLKEKSFKIDRRGPTTLYYIKLHA